MYLLYSGQLFFVAAVLFAAAVFLPKRFRVLALLAFALAVFSAPPFPWWMAIPLLLAAVTPSVSEGSGWRRGALPSPRAAPPPRPFASSA